MSNALTFNSCADNSISDVRERAGLTRQSVVLKSDDIVEELIPQQHKSSGV